MYSIDYLLKNSNLPGPRGNLGLLYDFSKKADINLTKECLNYIKPDTNNSPEEFVGMCGILAYARINQSNTKDVLNSLQKYASHKSWRIREAIAMSIQEISENALDKMIENIRPWVDGNYFEQRAVIAGLCEPKLLRSKNSNIKILKILEEITQNLNHDNKLTEPDESLRKTLGYGWSVVIVASPEDGKIYFEKLLNLSGKHINWIIKENLKKNRLIKMDSKWVEKCSSTIGFKRTHN